jgi:hypothetical protein
MEKKAVNISMGVDGLHWESRKWISELDFSVDEVKFFTNLLKSYVFVPDTPELFEVLQEYQQELNRIDKKCKAMKKQVREHENQLSGLLELDNHTLDDAYRDKHRYMREDMEEFTAQIQKLKLGLFNYGQVILKKRHNPDR